MSLPILYEDNHLLVVDKPAGLITQGADAGEESAFTLAQEYVKEKYKKPGKVYLGVVSRLDAAVSGVLVFARTSKAAARLSAQFACHTAQKTYLALVPTCRDFLEGSRSTFVDWLWKNETQHRIECVPPGQKKPGSQRAVLTADVLQQLDSGDSLIGVQLETGRKHQIRVQLANHFSPILGDAKYGSTRDFPRGIALHARELRLEHPTSRKEIAWQAPLPKYWPDIELEDE